jgi:hypothetical protein
MSSIEASSTIKYPPGPWSDSAKVALTALRLAQAFFTAKAGDVMCKWPDDEIQMILNDFANIVSLSQVVMTALILLQLPLLKAASSQKRQRVGVSEIR